MADEASAENFVEVSIELSDDELDIHVCGKCKASFTDLTAYIAHKKAKACSKPNPDTEATLTDQSDSATEGESGVVVRKTVVLPIAPLSPGSSTGNKVVVELLDPVDVNSVITDGNIVVHNDGDGETHSSQETAADKPKKRHKRKNSTPKTTRKTAVATSKHIETTDSIDETNHAVTVHIPESQLVHLGADSNASSVTNALGIRKQEATSVFVPIYLTTGNSKKTFKCSKCPAEFRSKEERCDHGSLHKKHFKCSDCNKKYHTPEALEAHRANETHVHTCDECGKIFHSQIYLKRHQAVHVVERNFACDICHKRYTSQANCRAHKRSVHALVKKHVCDECGKAFARKDKLKRHQLIHIPYPNRPVFPCPFRSHTGCTSTFYREDKLKRHLFTHSKEKPYKCSQCEKGFARKDNLNDHMKTHTKDFSYVCALCQKGFLGPAKLKKHLKAVHPDQEYEFETLTQRARDAPTMATLKPIATTTTTTTIATDNQPVIEDRTFEPEKSINTPVSVGLEEVSQAICAQAVHYESSHDECESSDKEKEIAIESPEPMISASLPPAPPLIHQSSCASSSSQITLPSASVFMPPRIGFQYQTPYSRDMVTIPSDLLSIVHGLGD